MATLPMLGLLASFARCFHALLVPWLAAGRHLLGNELVSWLASGCPVGQ